MWNWLLSTGTWTLQPIEIKTMYIQYISTHRINHSSLAVNMYVNKYPPFDCNGYLMLCNTFSFLSPSYIPSYGHVGSGYREKSLICKGHLSYMCNFITEYQGCRDPAMKICMHIIFCVHTVWLQMHPCLKDNIRETLGHVFSLLVLSILPIYLQSLHVMYDTLTCTLHVYKPTVWLVASRSLFLDFQPVRLLSIHFICTCKSLLPH